MPKPSPAATEVDAYVFIKRELRTLGWDVRSLLNNPVEIGLYENRI